MKDKKVKILVVDDEPDVVETLRHLLSLKGYDAYGALSGEEALGILEKEKIDLVLLDIMMSGLKGGEVARLVKEKYPNIKIIIVTGYANEVEALSRELILDGALIKPVNIADLYNKLLETLGQKEIPLVDLKAKQGIKARLLLIKARLLFIEPSPEVHKFLSGHFKGLSSKGEFYETSLVSNEGELIHKLASFNPDILIANGPFLESCAAPIIAEITDKKLQRTETIIYNPDDIGNTPGIKLDELTKAVETACIKKGLIEIKWVEI